MNNQPNSRSVSLITHSTAPKSVSPNMPYGFESAEEGDSKGALFEYWGTLRRNTGTIALASVAGLVLGFAIGIPMKPVYRAKTSLEVLTLNEDFMNMKQATPITSTDNNYDTSEEQTQAKLLESSALIKRVVAKLDNATLAAKHEPLATKGWRGWLHLPRQATLSKEELLLLNAAASIKVRPTPRTRVLEVTVDSTDAQLATNFANTLTQEFIAQNMEARWATTQRTSEWLSRELDEARDRLRHSEDALQSYARSSGLIFTDETTNVATEKLQQVQQQLSLATADRIAKQSRFELAQNSPPDSLSDIINDPGLRETQDKINDLKRQLADLMAIYSPEYSKVRRIQAELEAMQTAFNGSRADILSRIKTDFQEANRRESLLGLAYQSQARDVSGQDEQAIQYNILKRDVDSNRQLYDTMLQQMKQASITSAMRASNVRVVDPAELPDSTISPNFKLNSLLGMVSGLLVSVFLVTIRERADRTLQQPGDIKLWLDLPEIGIIPSVSAESKRNPYAKSELAEASQSFTARTAANTNKHQFALGQDAIELVTLQKTPSLIAEAFRSALTSILFMGEGEKRSRVLVFTSANAADGKTTVASNLAIAAAEIRCKVLIIDADLRRPRMHQIFGVSNDKGLTNLLQCNLSDEEISAFLLRTNVPNLDVLPSGLPTNAAAHLLYSPNFSLLLERVRTEYDLIIIDSPPMLQLTDARLIGRLADSVILVARSGKTTRDALLAAKERLTEDRISVLGAVLNDWNPKNSPNGYYGYYDSSYTRS